MDVDDNGGDTDTEDDDNAAEMSETSDGEGEGSTPKKKSKKLKPRKSQLDLNALNEEQNVLAQFDAMEIQQMRIMKKYYADAITFIDHVEGAMDVLCGLLGSKSKAEVLEVMDFFRVAYEIGFVGATVSIYAFLHYYFNLKYMPYVGWNQKDAASCVEEGRHADLGGGRQGAQGYQAALARDVPRVVL